MNQELLVGVNLVEPGIDLLESGIEVPSVIIDDRFHLNQFAREVVLGRLKLRDRNHRGAGCANDGHQQGNHRAEFQFGFEEVEGHDYAEGLGSSLSPVNFKSLALACTSGHVA